MDYYVILGVEKDATEEQIKKAYKRKALQFHPDKNKDADAEEKFKEIAEAYEVLSDVNKKSIFDKYGEKGLNQKGGSHANGFSRNTSFHPSDPFDLFKSFFGDHDPLSDIFASVFNQHVNPFSNGSHQFSKLNNISLSVKDDPSATTTYEERNGDGGTVHITKTIIGGDGKVRREMRFRTQSASRADEEERRRDESKTVLGRQQSAPTGHVSTSIPIKLNKPTERKEKENIEKEKEISTATITIKAPKPKPCPTIISNIRINHVKTPEMKRREDNVVNLPETKITIKLKT